MPRKPYKYHYIYKTTCLINDSYYIGMHSTDDLDDGYFGSGKKVWESIKKHGKENHKTEIVEFCDTREILRDREHEIITKEIVLDPLCMNLAIGGCGYHILFGEANGFFGKKRTPEHKKAMLTGFKEKLKNPTFKKKFFNKIKTTRIEKYGNYKNGWEGKSHSEETKRKIGEKNSKNQFGKPKTSCWVTNNIETKKILKTELFEYLNKGWRSGRINIWNKK